MVGLSWVRDYHLHQSHISRCPHLHHINIVHNLCFQCCGPEHIIFMVRNSWQQHMSEWLQVVLGPRHHNHDLIMVWHKMLCSTPSAPQSSIRAPTSRFNLWWLRLVNNCVYSRMSCEMAEKLVVICRLCLIAFQQILVSIFDQPGKSNALRWRIVVTGP